MSKVVSIRKITVGQVADARDALARRVHGFYVEMGQLLRKLEAYKRRHGFCTCGISCLKIATGHSYKRGSGRKEVGLTLWCDDHDPKNPSGERKVRAFSTPYGLMRLAERLREVKARQSTKKRTVRRRAA